MSSSLSSENELGKDDDEEESRSDRTPSEGEVGDVSEESSSEEDTSEEIRPNLIILIIWIVRLTMRM